MLCWSWVTWAQQLFSSWPRELLILWTSQHILPPSPSTVCQCPRPDHTPHCVPFKDLCAINRRWWQLTPHNHQGRDNNFFVQNHLCSDLLSGCQWLSFSFHALRCGFYLGRALPLSDCICHFMPCSSALPAKGLSNRLKIPNYKIQCFSGFSVSGSVTVACTVHTVCEWAFFGDWLLQFEGFPPLHIEWIICCVICFPDPIHMRYEWMLHCYMGVRVDATMGVWGGESLPWAAPPFHPYRAHFYPCTSYRAHYTDYPYTGHTILRILSTLICIHTGHTIDSIVCHV